MTHPDPGRPSTVITADGHASASTDVYREFLVPVGEHPGITPELVARPLDEAPDDSACPTFQLVRYQRRRAGRS